MDSELTNNGAASKNPSDSINLIIGSLDKHWSVDRATSDIIVL